MKQIILLLIQFIPSYLFSQFKVSEYSFVKDSSFSFITESNFSKFQFKKDKTYIFKYRTSLSCFLWQDTEGTWSTRNGTLILKDLIYANNPTIKKRKSFKTSDNKIIINLVDTTNTPIKGFKVKAIFRNTYDSLITYSNEQGSILIDTYSRSNLKHKNPSLEINDVDIWIFNEKGEFIGNELTYLSSVNNFTIRDKYEGSMIERTTYFLIKNKKISFIKCSYSKAYEFNGGVPMYGNYLSY